jgi:hypothetical protein
MEVVATLTLEIPPDKSVCLTYFETDLPDPIKNLKKC